MKPVYRHFTPFFLCLALLSGTGSGADNKGSVAQAGNAFAMDLFSAINKAEKPGSNTLFSPLSVGSAGAMLTAGAKGETQKQLLDEMRLAGVPDVDSQYGKLLRDLCSAEPKVRIANSLVLIREGVVDEGYEKLLSENYDAEIMGGNLETINSWVDRKTEGKIPRILEDLSPDTVCVLLNAVYFKGDWAKPFTAEETQDRPFTLANGETEDAPTMNIQDMFRLVKGDGYKAIELPYTGKNISMVVLLPEGSESFGRIENGLGADGFIEGVFSSLEEAGEQEIDVYLPKFSFESTLELRERLIELGIEDAFVDGKADFSTMSAKEALYVSRIVHKAFVEVGEKGTEAAAATAVVMDAEGMPDESLAQTEEFRADKPFFFFIVDRGTQTILFAGRVMDPTR